MGYVAEQHVPGPDFATGTPEMDNVEDFFGRIKHFRRIVTRYSPTSRSYVAMIRIAAIRLVLA